MAIYKVINESTAPEPEDTLNESGGAHQKLARLRREAYKKKEEDVKQADQDVDDMLNKKSEFDLNKFNKAGELRRKLEKTTPPYKTDLDRALDKPSKGDRSSFKMNGKKYTLYHNPFNNDKRHDDRIRRIKRSLGVGDDKPGKAERRKPGFYKEFQDFKKNETFDMCADYVVGCLEGSVDEFDLDLFTEASAFIIDCLDENEE